MALRITNNNGIFEINGSIIGTQVKSLQKHFNEVLHQNEYIIVSMDKVERIDVSAVKVLKALYRKAMQLNKVFLLIGKENETVRTAFGINSYILRKDFV